MVRIGSRTLPQRTLERTGGGYTVIEYWNLAFEVDPSDFEIPPQCPPYAGSAALADGGAEPGDPGKRLRELLPPEQFELYSRLATTKHLFATGAAAGEETSDGTADDR